MGKEARGGVDPLLSTSPTIQVRLWQLGQLLPPRLAEHLESHAVLPVLYASSWFLTCFASDFPLPFAARIMDLVVCDCYAAPILKVALAVMDAAAPLLIEVQDIEVAVEHLKKDVPRWPLERLQEILTEGLVKPWTPHQRAILTRINGVESVAEAVRRVERRQTVAGCEIERHASEAAEDELRRLKLTVGEELAGISARLAHAQADNAELTQVGWKERVWWVDVWLLGFNEEQGHSLVAGVAQTVMFACHCDAQNRHFPCHTLTNASPPRRRPWIPCAGTPTTCGPSWRRRP